MAKAKVFRDCLHPRISKPCPICRFHAKATRHREEADTITRLIRAMGSGDTLDEMNVRSALTSACSALKDDARVFDDIAESILAKYTVE